MAGVTHNLAALSLLFFLAHQMAVVVAKPKIVEMNVVVDDLAKQNWVASTGKTSDEEFIEEIESIFVEVSELYSSLRKNYRVDVQFVIKNLTINAKNVVHTSYKAIGTEGLTQFQTWLNKKKPYEKTDYDLALLLTGNDVVSLKSRSLLGFGMIGYVCTKTAVGMIEFNSATYKLAFVIAHEMGHILGANHDGTPGEYGASCKPDGYIMTASTVPTSKNHFDFSYCSYEYIYYKFTGLPWECLDNGSPSDYVKGKRLGTLMTADEACQRDLDNDAFLDRGSYYVYGDDVCTSLKCDRGDGSIANIFSPQGLYCGKNKQCIRGNCVETDEGRSDVLDECPFGDQPKIDYKGYKSCDDLPLYYCGVMKNICCKKCNITVLGLPDETCRQLENNPKALMYRKAYESHGYGDFFCKWLACVTGNSKRETHWSWHHTPDGMICGANKRCLGQKCLPSNDSLPYLDDLCPYGDQPYLWSHDNPCIKFMPSYHDDRGVCRSRNWGTQCCAYCRYI